MSSHLHHPSPSGLRLACHDFFKLVQQKLVAREGCPPKLKRRWTVSSNFGITKARTNHASEASMYVYRLKSLKFPKQVYVGITTNPKNRLTAHNEGQCSHTTKYKPWKMEICIWFHNEQKAIDFERYLKSGSGRAFCVKHF